jgi:hypothetical protein
MKKLFISCIALSIIGILMFACGQSNDKSTGASAIKGQNKAPETTKMQGNCQVGASSEQTLKKEPNKMSMSINSSLQGENAAKKKADIQMEVSSDDVQQTETKVKPEGK